MRKSDLVNLAEPVLALKQHGMCLRREPSRRRWSGGEPSVSRFKLHVAFQKLHTQGVATTKQVKGAFANPFLPSIETPIPAHDGRHAVSHETTHDWKDGAFLNVCWVLLFWRGTLWMKHSVRSLLLFWMVDCRLRNFDKNWLSQHYHQIRITLLWMGGNLLNKQCWKPTTMQNEMLDTITKNESGWLSGSAAYIDKHMQERQRRLNNCLPDWWNTLLHMSGNTT